MTTSSNLRVGSSQFRVMGLLATFAVLAGCATLQPREPRIVAIGDIHGDYGAFEEVMIQARLMGEDGNWIGGNSILVQTGAIPDRGPDTRRIIEHLRVLQEQAADSGGKIITLVANHEAMNVIGDLRYVHPGEYQAFVAEYSNTLRDRLFADNEARIVEQYRSGLEDPDLTAAEVKVLWEERFALGRVEHQEAWAPDGEIGAWVSRNQVVTVVGETLFVHGGVSGKYTKYTLDEIDAMSAEALRARSRDSNAIINDPLGPLWYRGLIRKPCAEDKTGIDGAVLSIEEELQILLEHFGVERIVVGHTPSLSGIKAIHGARVIQIDTGMSAHYGGTIAFLETTPEGVFADNDGVVVRIEDPVAVDPAEACPAVAVP